MIFSVFLFFYSGNAYSIASLGSVFNIFSYSYTTSQLFSLNYFVHHHCYFNYCLYLIIVNLVSSWYSSNHLPSFKFMACCTLSHDRTHIPLSQTKISPTMTDRHYPQTVVSCSGEECCSMCILQLCLCYYTFPV